MKIENFEDLKNILIKEEGFLEPELNVLGIKEGSITQEELVSLNDKKTFEDFVGGMCEELEHLYAISTPY